MESSGAREQQDVSGTATVTEEAPGLGPTGTGAIDVVVEGEGLGGQSKMEPSRDLQEDDNGKPSGDQKKEDGSASVELRTGHDQTNAGQQLPQSNDDKSVKEDAVVDHSSPDESANGSRSDSDTKSESTENQVGTIEQPAHSNELEEKGTEQIFSDFSVGGGKDDNASKPLVIPSSHKKQLLLKQKQLIGGFAAGGGGIIFAALATVVIFLEKGAALAGKLSTKDAGITYLSLATVLLFAAVICFAVARWGVKENQKQLPESKITSDCAGASTSSIEMS